MMCTASCTLMSTPMATNVCFVLVRNVVSVRNEAPVSTPISRNTGRSTLLRNDFADGRYPWYEMTLPNLSNVTIDT